MRGIIADRRVAINKAYAAEVCAQGGRVRVDSECCGICDTFGSYVYKMGVGVRPRPKTTN